MSTLFFLLLSNGLSIMLIGLFFFVIDLYSATENPKNIVLLWFKQQSIKKRTLDEILEIYSTSFLFILRSIFVMSLCLILLDNKVDWHELDKMSISKIIVNFILTLFFSLLILGLVHYSLHNKHLYLIHKTHHRYLHPVAITAYYHSLTETVINFIIFYIFIIPLNYFCFAIVVGNFLAMIDHSGYNIFGALYHDYHHSRINVNYITLPFVDKLLGTYYNK
jgi:sterol desaturase/sphingolipid hydroxylase (fatty acid hydroxylase superfamily)